MPNSVVFLMLEITNIHFPTWKVKTLYLYRTNLSMVFSVRKDIPAKKFLELQKSTQVVNWYYNILILRHFSSQLRSELNKENLCKELVLGVCDALEQMMDLYTQNEQQKTKKEFLQELAEVLLVLSKFKGKVNQELNTSGLSKAFSISIENSQHEEFFKALVAFQVFFEWNGYDCLGQQLTESALNNVLSNLNSEDQDIKQACKDLLTFMAINPASRKLLLRFDIEKHFQEQSEQLDFIKAWLSK
mmetsp:Transcript_13053/g.19033  ORF Transcript_13053/g.19033 Transcript_13053/m.19033 type:complete len:245 (+) Transcript_13053:135-869(+)